MILSNKVIEHFKAKERKALELIKSYAFEFVEIGIFGSYARNTYTAISDIDILVVSLEKPARWIRGSIRDELDLKGVDVHFVSLEYFNNSNDNFMNHVRKDYIRRV